YRYLHSFPTRRSSDLLQNSDVPIMFLTAKNSSEDRIAGLKKGADDYLVKPFNLEELILRVGILVRRGMKGEELKELNSYQIGDRSEEHTSELQSRENL